MVFLCSYSTLCAPAIPSAARGKNREVKAKGYSGTPSNPVFALQSQKGTPLTTLMKDPYILIAAGGALEF